MPKSLPLEKQIRQFIQAEVRKLGGKAWLLVENNRRGFPDLTILHPLIRHAIFVELKRSELQHTTPQQTYVIQELKNLGQDVYVVKGTEQAREFIEMFKSLLKK